MDMENIVMTVTEQPWYALDIIGFELWRLMAFSAAVFGGYLAGRILALIFRRFEDRALKSERRLTAAIWSALASAFGPLGLALGVKFGVLFLDLTVVAADVIGTIASVFVVVAIGWLCFCLVEVPTVTYARWSSRQESKLTDMLVPIMRTGLRVVVVLLTIVQMVQVVSDKPISSILAGLGIGGLAFALAAQDSLKHLFGSVVIFTDRPFEVGDRLVVDGHDGPVEEVGFRSTRIRTLDGHLVTIPNGDLVNKSIQNVTKRPYIRRICNISITYDTPPEKIEEGVQILKDLLKDHEGMHPDFPPRVYFKDLNSDNLNIFVLYWYHPPAYWDFLAFSERFNLEMIRKFREAGIDFAFPTRTLYLAGDQRRPLNIGLNELPDKSS
jgi:MscS family membrane protein